MVTGPRDMTQSRHVPRFMCQMQVGLRVPVLRLCVFVRITIMSRSTIHDCLEVLSGL